MRTLKKSAFSCEPCRRRKVSPSLLLTTSTTTRCCCTCRGGSRSESATFLFLSVGCFVSGMLRLPRRPELSHSFCCSLALAHYEPSRLIHVVPLVRLTCAVALTVGTRLSSHRSSVAASSQHATDAPPALRIVCTSCKEKPTFHFDLRMRMGREREREIVTCSAIRPKSRLVFYRLTLPYPSRPRAPSVLSGSGSGSGSGLMPICRLHAIAELS